MLVLSSVVVVSLVAGLVLRPKLDSLVLSVKAAVVAKLKSLVV